MTIRRKRTSVAVAVLVAAVAVGAFLAAGASARESALPRSQTLYTSGTAWGPFTQFNPLRSSGNATGTVGLLYETLFRYDPLKDRYIPWLATSGKWVGTTFVVTLRKGVTWNDGKPFTGADVKFTFETGKLEGSELSTMWKTGLTNIVVKGNTFTVSVDGKQTVTWTQPADWNGGREGPGRSITGPGTIAFQAHDPKSVVFYKNVRIKPLD